MLLRASAALAGPLAALLAALLAIPAAEALGHAQLTSPAPRAPGAKKKGPCGGDRPARPHRVRAGSLLVVRWLEYVDHPGRYRVRLLVRGGRWRTLRIVRDRRVPAGRRAVHYAARMRLPRRRGGAVVQVVQVMTDTRPATYYFSCADLRLV